MLKSDGVGIITVGCEHSCVLAIAGVTLLNEAREDTFSGRMPFASKSEPC